MNALGAGIIMLENWRDVIGRCFRKWILTLKSRDCQASGEHTGIAWTAFALNLSEYNRRLELHLHKRWGARPESASPVRYLSAYRDRTHEAATKAMWAGRLQDARDGFRQAALYAAQASVRCTDREIKALNQAKAWSSYERYRALAPFPVKRLRWESSGCAGYLHVPAADGRYPLLILFPDDFSLKETLSPLVDAGLNEGIAVMTLDPPGWQVSSGSRWQSADDWGTLMAGVMQCLRHEEQVDGSRVAAAGMLTGAFWAFLAGQLEPGIRFITAVAPLLPLPDCVGYVRDGDSSFLTECILEHAGCSTIADYRRQWVQLLNTAIPRPVVQNRRLFLHSCSGDFEGELPALLGGVDLLSRCRPGSDLDRWMIERGYKRMWKPALDWLAVQFRLREPVPAGGSPPPHPCTAVL